MAYIPRSSFSQAPGVIPMQLKKKHTIRVFSLLGTLLMIVSLIATAGVFFYKGHLEKQLSAAQAELNALSDSDNERRMAEIEVYDRKLNVAHNLLDNHIAVSRVFAKLEDVTKQTIQFKSFEFLYDPGFEAELTLTGDTPELGYVALQKTQLFKDGIFSDFMVRSITTRPLTPEEEGVPPASTQKRDADEGIESELGVGFEVIGLFDMDALAFTGESLVRNQPVPMFTESSEVAPDAVVDIDAITASTSASSNDDTL